MKREKQIDCDSVKERILLGEKLNVELCGKISLLLLFQITIVINLILTMSIFLALL